MTRQILTILVVTMAFAACKARKEKQSAESPKPEKNVEIMDEPKVSSDKVLREIQLNRDYQWPRETDPFNILALSLNADVLEVTVEYGGGCKEHEFKMNWTGAWMKSMPPKINLWLEHENNDDNCRALIRETLYFDLAKVQNSSSSSIVIILNGDEEKSLTYSYPKK